MQVLKVNAKNPEKEAIQKAAKVLELGGVIIYPTDTVYGLGANILNQQALERVFDVKMRDRSKPSSIAFRDIEQAEKFAYVTNAAKKLAEKFLPGPLTLMLQSKIPMEPFLGGEKITVRIIDHPVVSAILKEVKFPITSTSANISGETSSVDARQAIDQIGDQVDLVLDAGETKYKVPSTIVDLSSGEVEIFREGAIPKKEILEVVG